MEERRRDHNLRLILSNTSDTEGSSTGGTPEGSATHPQFTYIARTSRLGILVGELVPVIALVTLPLSVHAGVFSSLISILDRNEVVFERTYNDELLQDTKLLSATNNADPSGGIGGGDIIVEEGALVPGGTIGEDELARSKTFAGEISVYTVREGDTLSQIAQMFEVTSNTILWSNDLKSKTDIHPGDSLVILPIVGVRHVVKEGDTLAAIAKKYEGNEEEILDYNQLASASELTVGQTLVIPGGEISIPASSPAAKTYAGGGSAGNSTGFSHPAPGAVRTQGIHGYNAVDLASNYGAAIRAAAAGQVIVSKSGGWNGGYGNYIVVRHADGTQTLYAHLSSNAVGAGESVVQGQTIGAMGNSGRSTGTHLHFEVRGARNPF